MFPSSRNPRYKMFFEKDRYFNKLLRERLFTAPVPNHTSLEKSGIRGYGNSHIATNYATATTNPGGRKPGNNSQSKPKRNMSNNVPSIRNIPSQRAQQLGPKLDLNNSRNRNGRHYQTVDREKMREEETETEQEIMRLLDG